MNMVSQNNIEIWKAMDRNQKVNLLLRLTWKISKHLRRNFLTGVYVHEVQHLSRANTEQVLFLIKYCLLKCGGLLKNLRSPETSDTT